MVEPSPLRRGWTTGACAAAATKSAVARLVGGEFLDPVSITLPKGEQPSFSLAIEGFDGEAATAGIVKDAGDDPDVTHGAMIVASVRLAEQLAFRAGPGVGTVTAPGLPLAVGEPAINPRPREIIEKAILDVADDSGFEVTLSVPGGKEIAARTWNPRLGIVGGLSILGTTGIVQPFSCAAWIHSIHRGVDVARALGHDRLVAATGSTSETTALRERPVQTTAIIDMGDFAGGLLKYLKRHPVPHLTIAGGFAKMSKLAAGRLDLHSSRSQVDTAFLAELAGLPEIREARTGLDALRMTTAAGVPLGARVARRALETVSNTVGPGTIAEVLVVDRDGHIVGRAPE